MGKRNLSSREKNDGTESDERRVHPLGAGIEEAKNGESMCLEEILSKLD